MPDQTPNLRDVGGLHALEGRQVKRGQVLRSAVPFADDHPTPGVVWPPSEIIDLRSDGELATGHPLADQGALIHHVPLLAALSPDAWGVGTLQELYLYVLRDVPDRLTQIVELVTDADGPVLVHCAAGKDRTGLSIALVLGLVGVDRESIVRDYLTSRDHADQIRARLEAVRIGPRVVPEEFLRTPLEAINGVLDTWESHRHGVEGWARDAGLSADTLGTLRERLLDPPT